MVTGDIAASLRPTCPPVLLLAFNRPGHTKRVISAIREAKPARLYFAVDGPRRERSAEAARVQEVQACLDLVDWDCACVTLFREENLGCQLAVKSAIDWFFDHEPEGVILEDDTVPSPDFFAFSGVMLNRFRSDPRVMAVSGSYFGDLPAPATPFYFSRYALMWGWATWRDRWARYDPDVSDYDIVLESLDNRVLWRRHWRRVFRSLSRGEIDTWDFQWILTVFRHNGLVVRPSVNLVENIGFGPDATHTTDAKLGVAGRTVGKLDMESLNVPGPVIRNAQLDLADEKYWLGLGVKSELIQAFPALYALYRRVRF